MVDRRLLVELLAASDLLMTQNLERLHANLSACADEICLALLEHLEREDPATQVSILALGKWGSRELGLQSDLDFVFVTRQPLTEAHHRRCRRFLSLLSAAHPGGRLYSYDMRLRPSGHAGPLLLEIGELQRFLELKAEAWQRQAHLRARWIGPATGVGMPAISLRQVDDGELGQLSLIRSQLIVEAETVGSIDLKAAPGGLIDCEFTAQIALLREAQSVPLAGSTYLDLLDLLAQRSSDWAEARPRLLAGYNRLRRVEQTYHLVCESGGTKIKLGGREWERLRRKAETNGDDLAENLRNELRDLKQLNASLRESRAK
jgi:glutamate-ammonia-ligase adenylyltransferase